MKPVISSLENKNKFLTNIKTGKHHFSADEPESAGGTDQAADPISLALGSLGACTAMTLKIYYDFKKIDWNKIEVQITSGLEAIDAESVSEATRKIAVNGKVRRIKKTILITSDMEDKMLERAAVIAEKCPVNQMMKHGAVMQTTIQRG